jgi:ferrous iron transport protein B
MWERGWIFLRRAGTVILALSILLWALLTYPKPSNPDATPSEAIAHSIGGRMGMRSNPSFVRWAMTGRLGWFDWQLRGAGGFRWSNGHHLQY